MILIRKRFTIFMAVCLLFSMGLPVNGYAFPSGAYGANLGTPIYGRPNWNTSNESAIYTLWSPDMIADKIIDKREEGLDMKGIIPELTEAFGEAHQDVNARITTAIGQKAAAAKDSKARSVEFSYEFHTTETLVSIIIYADIVSASSKTEVLSVNFNPVNGAAVSLSEAIGVEIAPLAEKLLTEQIRRNPEKYNTAFGALPSDQAFYLTGSEIVLLFNEFQLAPGIDGVVPLTLYLDRISSVTVSRSDYAIYPGYNLKMIPLRQVCDALGYEFRWSEQEQRIELYRDGNLIMELTPGVNNYLVRDKKVRSLEAPPERIKDTIYVPISFFDQILSLITYSIDARGNITFLSYPELP